MGGRQGGWTSLEEHTRTHAHTHPHTHTHTHHTHTYTHTHILTVREPEAGLPIVADIRAIGAMTIIRFDSARGRMLAVRPRGALGVDRVARKRHHHGPMSRDGRDEQSGREGVAVHWVRAVERAAGSRARRVWMSEMKLRYVGDRGKHAVRHGSVRN